MHLTVFLSYHRNRENSIKKGRRMMAKAFCDSLLPKQLFSCNSACRTSGFASTAVDAGISYNVFRFAFFDGTGRASASASAAFYAFVGNNMHGFHLQTSSLRGNLPFVFLIITRIDRLVNEYRMGKDIGIS